MQLGQWFGRSIAQRLFLGLGLVLVISFIGAGLGYGALVKVAHDSAQMYGVDLAAERTASDWYRNITNGVNRTSAIAVSADPGLADYFAKAAAESSKQSGELQKQLETYMSTPEEVAMFERLSQARKAYLKTRDAVSAAKKAGQAEEARKVFDEQFQPAATVFQAAIQEIVQYKRARMDADARELEAANAGARKALLAFSLVALCFGAWMSWALARSISQPLVHASVVADAIAKFDLSHRIHANGADETGRLLRSLQAMQASLVKMIGEVRGSTDSISTASAEIATGNMDLSSRTEQTASNLQEAAASLTQLTDTVRQSADSAMTANQLAKSAAETAQRGGEVMTEVVSTMDEISNSSRRINDIIGVIDGIAFQTNILALNAAVEAARAGEQGRGFAVVASEVRSLAQRSAGAAKEIKALISASEEKVEVGSRLVKNAGGTMNEIVSSVQRVTDIIGEISSASAEQSDGIRLVNGAVGQLDQMTQQNAALVEEAASAAESLKDQSRRLAGAVAAFKFH